MQEDVKVSFLFSRALVNVSDFISVDDDRFIHILRRLQEILFLTD